MDDQASRAPQPLLTEKHAADFLTVSVPTLRRWRRRRSGPAFVQLSSKRIAYRPADLDAWARARQPTHAPQPDPASRRSGSVNQSLPCSLDD